MSGSRWAGEPALRAWRGCVHIRSISQFQAKSPSGPPFNARSVRPTLGPSRPEASRRACWIYADQRPFSAALSSRAPPRHIFGSALLVLLRYPIDIEKAFSIRELRPLRERQLLEMSCLREPAVCLFGLVVAELGFELANRCSRVVKFGGHVTGHSVGVGGGWCGIAGGSSSRSSARSRRVQGSA